MPFWSKKKKKDEKQEPSLRILSPCERGEHRFRDFDWYVEQSTEDSYYGRRYIVRVLEPYVCIHCGHREDKVLGTWRFSKKSDRQDFADQIKKNPHVGSLLEIEDAIHDMQLVDREYLSIFQQLHPDKKILDEAKPD